MSIEPELHNWAVARAKARSTDFSGYVCGLITDDRERLTALRGAAIQPPEVGTLGREARRCSGK